MKMSLCCCRHWRAKRHACMLREWLTVQSSEFCMLQPLLCVDAAVIVVVSVAYSQTITFTHQPHMLYVCSGYLNAMQLPTFHVYIHVYTIPHGIFFISFLLWSTSSSLSLTRCCLYDFFHFISFHFVLLFTLSLSLSISIFLS